MERNLFSTEGRIRRLTYWTRFFVVFGVGVISGLILKDDPSVYWTNVIVSVLLSIFIIIQGFKRMHDVGKNGWYTLIPIYNLIFHLTEGTRGKNKYGENPKEHGLHEFDFSEGISNLIFSTFISCGVFALLSETTNSSESFKNVAFIITLSAASLILFKGDVDIPSDKESIEDEIINSTDEEIKAA